VPFFFSNNLSLFGHTCSSTEGLLSSFAVPFCIHETTQEYFSQLLDPKVSSADCVFIWKNPKTLGQGVGYGGEDDAGSDRQYPNLHLSR
jgi:hypothetical protein